MNKNIIKLIVENNKQFTDKKMYELSGYYDETNLKEFSKNKIKNDDLTFLANYYNSDKGTIYGCAHNYTKVYTSMFKNYKEISKDTEIKLFEIGVASASSLKMWSSFFDKISITGIDINPSCKDFCKEFDNIEIIIGDVLKKEINDTYDIIIDDGSHLADDIIESFQKLYPKLNKDGIYVIEDLKTCNNISYIKAHFKFKHRKYSDNLDKFIEMNSRDKIEKFYEQLKDNKIKHCVEITGNSEICFIYK